MPFALSVIALVLGPFVYALGQRHPNARQILDGFIFIAIAGIVCVDIIPHAIGTGGVWTIAFLALGLAFPVILERTFHKQLPHAHEVVLVLAAIGLILHAAIDGIALLPLDGSASVLHNHLAIGVILHRLPVGMAIWWSVRPNFGTAVAVAVFAVIIAATAAAYFLGAPIAELAGTTSVAWFQAFVAGSLVHIVAFGVSHDHDAPIEIHASKNSWGYRIGVLLGIFLIFAVPHVA